MPSQKGCIGEKKRGKNKNTNIEDFTMEKAEFIAG